MDMSYNILIYHYLLWILTEFSVTENITPLTLHGGGPKSQLTNSTKNRTEQNIALGITRIQKNILFLFFSQKPILKVIITYNQRSLKFSQKCMLK